jgi:ADP-ribose pyrophosphatase
MNDTRISRTEHQKLSPWVTLVSRTVVRGAQTPQVFHSLAQSDYVSVLAVAEGGQIPLVRQFRPAVQRTTLELPGGLLDSGETAAEVAVRELAEEVGFEAVGEPAFLGKLLPDTGRLENRFWCYFVKARPAATWQAEPEVERVLYSREQLRQAIADGSFDHALHIALIGLAVMRGYLNWHA